MGTVIVCSNPRSRIPTPEVLYEAKLSDGTYEWKDTSGASRGYPNNYLDINTISNGKYKVTLRDGATSEGLRFIVLSHNILLGKRYANLSTTWERLLKDRSGHFRLGTSIQNLRVSSDSTWHYSSNIYESDNVYNFSQEFTWLVMLWEHGLTMSEFENWGAFPDAQVIMLWRKEGASSSEVFPIKKIEIVGERVPLTSTDSQQGYRYGGTSIVSNLFSFSTPRTIRKEDFEVSREGIVKISVICKKSNGEWTQWYPLSALETQTNVVGLKIRGDILIHNDFQAGTFINAGGTPIPDYYQGYETSRLNTVTFDSGTAVATYIGGNFTTRTLHLANVAKKVHATLVHKEGLNVKAYVSLRSEGNFVSGESLGVGNGNRRSVTLQHTTGLTNEGFKLYFNGVEQAVSSYSFASGSGLVTFTAPSGVSVKCDYFYNTGAENFVEMTRTATYRNEDKPGMLESQFKYETTTGGNVATLKAEVAGDGRIEEMAVFFNQ